MSDKKPSLYVVEKKEVVILVVLFVLVTVLSFTLGVRYGESVGKKIAKEEELAESEIGGHVAESIGGTLGQKSKENAIHEHEAEVSSHGGGHETEYGDANDSHKEEHHGAESDTHKESSSVVEHKTTSSEMKDTKSQVDKNSDEALLDALKTAGLESPASKAKDHQELPSAVKTVKAVKSSSRSGMYVVQVGSHPTRVDAQRQMSALEKKGIQADILPPFNDKQGQWHRVVVGAYGQKAEAEKAAKQLKQKGLITSYFVWRHP